MAARFRARAIGDKFGPPGTLIWGSGPSATTYNQDNTSWPARYVEQCADEVGQKDSDNGLSIDRIIRQVSPINGLFPGNLPPGSNRQYSNWWPPAVTEAIAHLALSPPSLNSAVTTLMARTNPGRRHVSATVAIGELRDLPKLVRQGGDLYTRYFRSGRTPRDRRRLDAGLRGANDGAGIYLAYQFGIAPMISDLRKLLDFQAVQERRAQELRRLYSGKGLKRRFTIYRDTVTNQSSVTLSSLANVIVAGQKTTITTGVMWGTIRWQPTTPPPPSFRSSEGQARLARQVAYGTNGHNFSDAWNLVPWTWLIDWFSDTGTWVEAHTNRNLPAKPAGINIMYHRTTTVMTTKTSHPDLSMGSSKVLRETKERSPRTGFTLPEANFGPILTRRQQSILGALAVTRHLRPGTFR